MNYNSSTTESAEHAHIMPIWALVCVWGALVGLTGLTVLAAQVDLGGFNTWAALGIATLKGLLVALFFMHLIFERTFNAFVFVAALFFVLLFIGLSSMDTRQNEKDMLPEYAPEMQR